MVESQPIPDTPRVIAPSPTASEYGESNSQYFPPVTRSSAKKTSHKSTSDAKESDDERDTRSRARSRSPIPGELRRRGTALPTPKSRQGSMVQRSKPILLNGLTKIPPNGELNGSLLSPESAFFGSSYWRAISRSPSPLGLIPIHRHWRSFVHRHEVPRKVLHVSIGFITVWLYTRHVQPEDIHPWLLGAVIPIITADVIRHRSEDFNRIYIKLCGALMRETEVHDRYNGVIFYLIGVWAALRFFPKDVGGLSILLLSWCDTAASTFGRLYGKYTPRIRKGKSLAGTLAALLTGCLTAWAWYGVIVPANYGFEEDFIFQQQLKLPEFISSSLGMSAGTAKIDGNVALFVMSIVCGFIASISELVDVWGLDDNITIPILSGLGLWGFLKLCT